MAEPCQSCGACCRAHYPDGTVKKEWVAVDNPIPISDALLAFGIMGNPVMRMTRAGRCAALVGRIGKSVSCAVYADRPSPCRNFTPGGDRCNLQRERAGLAPLEMPS